MKKILVYFYGYKSRLLAQSVDQLIKNQSGQNYIQVVVYDQTNVARPEKFIGSEYNHIHWDSLTSRFRYIDLLKKRQGFDFFMYVDGSKMFEKDWDVEFLKYTNQTKTIVSGSNNVVFNKNNYKFYPEYKKTKISIATRNNWVVKDFFFVSFDMLRSLPDISIFKYHGVEECLSMFAAYENIPVVAVPSGMVVDEEPDINANDFIPFSLYHNYSKIIDSFKSKDQSMPGIKELMMLIDYDFRRLEYFPYNTNDVEYIFISNLDAMSEARFHKVRNEIY